MSAPDHGATSRRRAAGPAQHLELASVVETVVYDVVGEREGRWAQVRAGITSLEEVRADVEMFTWSNPAVTWHVVARTTTTTEALADHVLDVAHAGATPLVAAAAVTAHEKETLW